MAYAEIITSITAVSWFRSISAIRPKRVEPMNVYHEPYLLISQDDAYITYNKFQFNKTTKWDLIEGTIATFRDANTNAWVVSTNTVMLLQWSSCRCACNDVDNLHEASLLQHNSLTPHSMMESISLISQLYLLCTANCQTLMNSVLVDGEYIFSSAR